MWSLVFNGSLGDQVTENGHEVLVYNNNGDVSLIKRGQPDLTPENGTD
jgi:hypothetical protein